MMSLVPTAPGRLSCFVLAIGAVAAHAQPAVPDAGTLLRQQPQPPAAAPAPRPQLAPQVPDLGELTQGPRFLVTQFRFTGATLVAEAELQAKVAPYRGQQLTVGILRLIAEQLTGYYLDKGYVARVLVPEQEIRDGVVTMKIVEGARGGLVFDRQGERVSASRVEAFIAERLPQGAPLDVRRLEEAVAILNEQPGVRVNTSLRTGAQEGEVAVVVVAADKPLVSGEAGINNGGYRGTGEAQLQAGLTLANPTGRFDAASLLVNASEGTAFGRADYGMAVGNRGLRLGVNASYLDYRIVQGGFRALDLHGTATTWGVAASYPLLRSRELDASLTAGYDTQVFVDRSAAGETGDRKVTVANLGITTSRRHALGAVPATTSAFAVLRAGRSDERNASARAADSAGRQVNGSFAKLAWGLSNVGELGADWGYGVALRGQLAGGNLDSSERMSLGGPAGVRAYPVGEATGDEGWVLNASLRKGLGQGLAGKVFYDVGRITVNHDTWAGWNAGTPNLPNRYTLSGIGAGIDWRIRPAALLSASVAVPVGSNPGRDANDRNVDGRSNGARLWVSLNAQF